MRLFWSPKSPFVRKVMVVLHETDQVGDVDTVRTPVQMAEPNPQVLEANPLNKIPTLLLDDGRVLLDSRVICEFFARRANDTALYPNDDAGYFEATSLQALGDGLLDLLLVWRNWHRDRGLAHDAADPYLDAFGLKVTTTLDHLESRAGELGERFDIGRVSIAIALAHLDFRWGVLDWRAGRPNLAAWHAEVSDRPSMRATRILDDSATLADGSAS
ncbi:MULTISPECIES: glutathione S-transferase family protein [Streptomyces]|uniref:Glutathione S-transferase n=2 Tax=Streptomyces rapamycinicus TaxID=1226757 RepID=A0A3L8R233_STRRN|nr:MULTISPECIES: glutathione S-transferase family protein [Streptomyces]MBB4781717.1 glutathione S-transferase [Streptomyces rapamycinicus]RLV73641.1 glutathione S-transferase [Streptomyces rapamycinicus NRRL 5491]UTO62292.1 glutathione S-transferase [Streptomyces rapamycinicus]UTP30247.1 glutathione S-transferase [Streptomyces rapamycinicus NRRL 5491]